MYAQFAAGGLPLPAVGQICADSFEELAGVCPQYINPLIGREVQAVTDAYELASGCGGSSFGDLGSDLMQASKRHWPTPRAADPFGQPRIGTRRCLQHKGDTGTFEHKPRRRRVCRQLLGIRQNSNERCFR